MNLDEIVRRTKKRVAKLPATFPARADVPTASLSAAIRSRNGQNAVISKIKCASPSRGIIRRNVDMPVMAGVMAGKGCAALSILTEPHFFGGSLLDIPRVKAAVNVPVLRKDIILDKRQIGETYALGADAILLIAAVLGEDLPDFVDCSVDVGLEPLVEVHSPEDAVMALATRAEIIGINNRDLKTLSINRSMTRELSGRVRSAGRIVVSESGMRNAEDVREMKPYCDAFLIGSAIMSHERPEKKLEEFVCA
jgi:indole-3-glycerol phosphate synthase